MGITSIFKIFAGRHHRQFVRKCKPIVKKINALEAEYQNLSDDALKAKTPEFMERFKKGETLDKLLPEAFNAVIQYHLVPHITSGIPSPLRSKIPKVRQG